MRAAFAPSVPSFDKAARLKPDVLTPLFDAIEKRSLALKAVTQPALRGQLMRAIVKAVVQGVLYPTVLVAIGIAGVRAMRRAPKK